ncbi:MAG: SecD/SecF family protein translocase subunit [Oscillospiraceae bacterium]|jgi:protein-export membrane protein SecD|nr:SecD/SecF family protein translocase subunit [Oscillospiraceae bacterium]
MRKTKKYTFFTVLILILGFSYLTTVGFDTYNGDIPTTQVKGLDQIRWGIDIRGGVDATFIADSPTDPSDPNYVEITNEKVDAAKSVIETRLLGKNITDYEVYPDYTTKRIVVRFPWQVGDTSFDPSEAVKELGETALMTFREGSPYDTTGEYYSAYQSLGSAAFPLILNGADVAKAESGYDSTATTTADQYIVRLTLQDSGKEKFSEATGRLIGKDISIWLDETCITAPTVRAQITDGITIISGSFTAETAKELADKINGGALPYKLKADNTSTISPSLGENAREVMVLAGIIGFALVAVFMICVYRMLGFIAVIGLIGQVFGTLAVLTGFFPLFDSFTLTVPGLAGIILSIGMGVDANVITSERIKEELRAGKSLDGALVSGYKRAFTAIFDGNITLILIAFVLMGAFGAPGSLPELITRPLFFMFGTSAAGTIYSFGFTLILGSIFNFFFGVFTSRLMTYSITRFRVFRKPQLYGGYKKGSKKSASESKKGAVQNG